MIPRVHYRDDAGKTVEYASTDLKVTPAELAKGERRKMDCVDCHNRPTHAFELPERAVDRRIDLGLVSRDLPFVKKKAVEVLRADYASRRPLARIVDGPHGVLQDAVPGGLPGRVAVESAAARFGRSTSGTSFPT